MQSVKAINYIRNPFKQFFDLIRFKKALRCCDTKGYRESYVCFVPTKLAWPQYFMKKDFEHVSMFYKSKEDQYIFIDFKCNRVEIHTLNENTFVRFTNVLKKSGGRIIKVKNNSPDVIVRFLPSIFISNYCVTLVKNMLGIKAKWVLTPFQLYKHLKKHYEYTEV